MTHWRNFANRTLDSGTLAIINVGPHNLIVVINSNKEVTTSRIQKTADFLCKFTNFRRYITLKIHIVALASINQILYFFRI